MAQSGALLLAAASVALLGAAQALCGLEVQGKGTTYDLSGLETQGYGYKVLSNQDNVDDAGNWTYVFNVCANLATPPPSNTGVPGEYGNNCNVTNGNDGTFLEGPAPAFQVSNNNGFCYRLSDGVETAQWTLLDDENPSRGVVLSYLHGNACADGEGDRELSVAFVCGIDSRNPFAREGQVVEEKDKCKYEIITESTMGCPQECPVVGGRLCSGAGVCDWDTDAQKSRCFCSPGLEGVDCSVTTKEPSSGFGATGGVLVFVCILLVALLGVLAYLWNRIRTLRLDPKAYSQLRGGGPGDDDGTDDI